MDMPSARDINKSPQAGECIPTQGCSERNHLVDHRQ